MSNNLKKPTLHTVELDDTFSSPNQGPPQQYRVIQNRSTSVPRTAVPQQQTRTAVKVSGYTPLMQQSTAQNTTIRPASIRTTQRTEGRTARDLLMKPGFEAQAEAQNMKISQYDKVSEYNRQSQAYDGNVRLTMQEGRQSTLAPTPNMCHPQEKITSTYIPNNQAYNNSSAQYISELERNIGEMKLEANHLKRTIAANEREIEELKKEMNHVQDENRSLLDDLSHLGNIKNQYEDISTELERMCADRDFHNEQHINLRNEILSIVKQEYEIESLKREKTFLSEELAAYKEKALIYEKQIDELNILAKRPVSQSAQGTEQEERYYAKV